MHPTLDLYATEPPSAQMTVDIFKDSWSSLLPGLRSGSVDTFVADTRVDCAHDTLNFTGKKILELGPLEGGHTYAMHKLDPKSITAVEGNSRSFLKCLVVKELFDLTRAKFLYGDIVKYLETTPERFDIIFCSGVLYHMREPLKLLSLIKEHTDDCYIWTGFYQRDVMEAAYGAELFRTQFGDAQALDFAGFQCSGYPQYYGDALNLPDFSGGGAASSVWLGKDDILSFLTHIGFDQLTVHGVDTAYGYAPRMSVSAQVRRQQS